jgi:mono/diheme cytochrome c family protein
MVPIIRGGRFSTRYLLAAALCFSIAAGSFALTGHAGQSRSITDGVYSAQQAARVQAVYQADCAGCHGNSMEGAGAGPPLAGESFLSNWSAQPLSALVDKIQKTMPFDAPGSLSRQQSIDLTAYMLQTGKFPAGQGELNEAALAGITMPMARTTATAATASGGATLAPPLGNVAELMRAIAFFNSNIIFNLQQHNPDTEPAKEVDPAGSDWIQWSYTVYPGWLAVDQAAVAITESAPLLLTPGRRCQNGKLAPVDNADWKEYTAQMMEVGKKAYTASKARNYAAFEELAGELSDACDNCHRIYRDRGGDEGSGQNRC